MTKPPHQSAWGPCIERLCSQPQIRVHDRDRREEFAACLKVFLGSGRRRDVDECHMHSGVDGHGHEDVVQNVEHDIARLVEAGVLSLDTVGVGGLDGGRHSYSPVSKEVKLRPLVFN